MLHQVQRRRSMAQSDSILVNFSLRLERLANSENLMNVVLGFIFANTVCMALEGVCTYEKDEYCKDMRAALEVLNVIFCIVFAIEFVIKIGGLGPRGFLRDPMNLLDVAIVLASLVELPSGNETFFHFIFDLFPEIVLNFADIIFYIFLYL